MSSLAQCRDQYERFLRSCLPAVSQVAANLPTMPKFRAVPSSKPKRYKFIEEKQPNWWQLPKDLRQTLFGSSEGQALAASLEKTPPFSHSIGKWIMFPELGRGSNYVSAIDLAREMLVSYLFAAGVGRWKPTAFGRVWHDCVSYFNPADIIVEYFLYAPIAFMPGVARRLDLGDGLAIRRLRVDEIAQLASLNPIFAGVPVYHRLTQWPVHFFVKRYEFEKRIVDRKSTDWTMQRNLIQWESQLNEEVAILRSLLNETLAVPTYAFIRDGYPRDPGGGLRVDLPWRARLPEWVNPPTRREVNNYARRRAKFLKLHGEPGWENVAASMRRFAVAWENPFRADILADIVAALEHLVVRGDREVSYKLRIRTAHFLAKFAIERQAIAKDLNDAYRYRSKVFHGGFVFDKAVEWELATRMKRPKRKLGKGGNPFHDVSEVHRLIYKVSNYYRRILEVMIGRGQLEIDWAAQGL